LRGRRSFWILGRGKGTTGRLGRRVLDGVDTSIDGVTYLNSRQSLLTQSEV
jgi:predicted NAD/FAD-dependent oxidoreductase